MSRLADGLDHLVSGLIELELVEDDPVRALDIERLRTILKQLTELTANLLELGLVQARDELTAMTALDAKCEP